VVATEPKAVQAPTINSFSGKTQKAKGGFYKKTRKQMSPKALVDIYQRKTVTGDKTGGPGS